MKLSYGKHEEYLYNIEFFHTGDSGFAIVRAENVSSAAKVLLERHGDTNGDIIDIHKIEKITNQHDRILSINIQDF